MSNDPNTDVTAAAIAQTALAIAKQAEEIARRAEAKADTALSACHSFQKDLGNLADILRQTAAFVESLQTRLGEWILRTAPLPAPDDPDVDGC